jgi:hypothetical protein
VVNKGERPYSDQFIIYEVAQDKCAYVLKTLRNAIGKLYMRGVVYRKLGDEIKAQEKFRKLKNMIPEQLEKWDNMTLREIFQSYFKEVALDRDLVGGISRYGSNMKNDYKFFSGVSLP